MKKLGKLEIEEHASHTHGNYRTHGDVITEKPIWGDIYQMEDSHETWGIIKTTITAHDFDKIEHAFKQINKEHKLNFKTKEKEDYYGQMQIQIYYTAPVTQITEQLVDIIGKMYWEGENYTVNFKRNTTAWKTVKKHETAKAL